MDNREVAKELVRLAKDLSAGPMDDPVEVAVTLSQLGTKVARYVEHYSPQAGWRRVP